ncbi:MAG TPA: O-antigen ligase family protein [Pyrinomonadaceae bacterium]|nr:O-antigen ligase family protein [Pyrinomonadaceae bacterium]
MLGKIIFGALLGIVVITPIPYGTVEPWWKAVFVCAVFGVFILAICDSIRVSLWSTLLPLVVLTGFAFLQSWTRISADPLQTNFFALQLAALTAFLALLYRYAATEARVRILVYAVIGVGITTALFGILRQTTQQQTGFVLPLLKPNLGFAQFVNSNHFAYLMEMAFGLGAGLLIVEGAKKKLFYLALLLPIWLGLVASNSRGGILAMLIQVVIAALLLVSFRSEGLRTPRLIALRAALILVLVVGVVVGTLWIGGDRLVSTIEAAGTDLSANTPTERDGASRNEIWRSSVRLFAAHPVFGVGLGAYWPRISAHHDASGALVPQEAHNDYLELLASGGVVGFALGVWFVVSVFRVARKNLWSSTGFMRAARVGAIVGIAGVAVHSLFDFGLHLLSNAVVLLTLIMIATTQIDSKKVVDLKVQQH